VATAHHPAGAPDAGFLSGFEYQPRPWQSLKPMSIILPYVDGFVIPVPKHKLDAYQAIAEQASRIWKDHGALDYYECVADDVAVKDMRSFVETAAAKPDETVVFAFIVYPSREARDATNAAVMADPRMKEICQGEQVFDCKRMSYGGFRTIVRA
jgi:uncharacterized protein YbaA (DUF1428 family)